MKKKADAPVEVPTDPAVEPIIEAVKTAKTRAKAVASGKAKTQAWDPPRSKGASGKETITSLKENPYRTFTVEKKHWYDGFTGEALDFALFLLEGYIWECRNSDRFHVVHNEDLGRAEDLRDRITSVIHRRDGEHFWPEIELEEQLALIDWVRLLPYMWD